MIETIPVYVITGALDTQMILKMAAEVDTESPHMASVMSSYIKRYYAPEWYRTAQEAREAVQERLEKRIRELEREIERLDNMRPCHCDPIQVLDAQLSRRG